MKKLIQAALSIPALLLSAAPAFAEDFTFPELNTPPLGEILRNILLIIFFFAAILALLFIVIGGVQWITAGGDPKAAQAARDRITAAIIGLVIVVAAFGITLIITTALGINIFEGAINVTPGTTNIFQ